MPPRSATGWDEYTCTDFTHFEGFIRQDGSSFVFELPNTALIPLSTDDGLTWHGEADATQTGVTCNKVPELAHVTFSMSPLTFSADPTTKQIMATSYSSNFSLEAPKSKSAAAVERYAGALTFFGLS